MRRNVEASKNNQTYKVISKYTSKNNHAYEGIPNLEKAIRHIKKC